MSEDEEREMIRDSIQSVQKATGQRISGWLAPALTYTDRTIDLLAEMGLSYTCDLFHDDQVTPVNTPTGKLCSVPYSLEYNDSIAFQVNNLPPRRYFDMLKAGFDRLYEEGADSGTVMCIPLHAYLVSHPYRMESFAQILEYICGHDDVWVTTAGEIAKYWTENYWDAAVSDIARGNA
jgi:peptidoglycan/xylan/chitin deacetylase (PgdA/CDA1 family)